MDVLLVVGLALVGLIALLVGLLAIPVELRLGLEHREGSRAGIEITGLLGLVDRSIERELAGPTLQPEPPSGPPEEPEHKTPTGPGARYRVDQALAVLRTDGFISHTGRALKALVTTFHVRALELDVTLGTGDPADTGILYGRAQAMIGPLHVVERAKVSMTPDFDRRIVEGGVWLTLRAVPLKLAWILTRYALSRTTIRAVRNARGVPA